MESPHWTLSSGFQNVTTSDSEGLGDASGDIGARGRRTIRTALSCSTPSHQLLKYAYTHTPVNVRSGNQSSNSQWPWLSLWVQVVARFSLLKSNSPLIHMGLSLSATFLDKTITQGLGLYYSSLFFFSFSFWEGRQGDSSQAVRWSTPRDSWLSEMTVQCYCLEDAVLLGSSSNRDAGTTQWCVQAHVLLGIKLDQAHAQRVP